MNNKIWIFIGSIVFFIAAIKTLLTQEIIGKAGYIHLGKYAYYNGLKNQDNIML
ncbi:MAG: hypothetical protein ABXS91_05615 [Sulfurimonas sp.]